MTAWYAEYLKVVAEYHAEADRFTPLDIDAWVARLRAAQSMPRPPQRPVVLWRGQAAAHPIGMSWTLHRSVATHFAMRHAHIGATIDGTEPAVVLLRAVAPPEAILARGHPKIGDDGERIVDPAALVDVKALVLSAGALRSEYLRSTRPHPGT